MDIEDELVAGDYEFDKDADAAVITRINLGITAPVMVTIPEGLRLEDRRCWRRKGRLRRRIPGSNRGGFRSS
jgi:cell division protein YceG involved in septum cleavage